MKSSSSHPNERNDSSRAVSLATAEGTGIPMKKVRKKDTIEMILSRPPMIVKSTLSQLRYHILVDGLKVPKDSEDVSISKQYSLKMNSDGFL